MIGCKEIFIKTVLVDQTSLRKKEEKSAGAD
jgi:hypothetical protein